MQLWNVEAKNTKKCTSIHPDQNRHFKMKSFNNLDSLAEISLGK